MRWPICRLVMDGTSLCQRCVHVVILGVIPRGRLSRLCKYRRGNGYLTIRPLAGWAKDSSRATDAVFSKDLTKTEGCRSYIVAISNMSFDEIRDTLLPGNPPSSGSYQPDLALSGKPHFGPPTIGIPTIASRRRPTMHARGSHTLSCRSDGFLTCVSPFGGGCLLFP